ncbi:bifunctional helix-turn-helix transcriptional regulator/GNAT family N-acetyltransferase [Serratia sp. IR-2025]
MNEDSLIETIRTASRTIVRELGFMRTTLAGTEFSPSAVHALLEIERQEMMTAAQLVLVLGLDKSSVSRMVGKLMRAGLLIETAGEDDTRLKLLCLSATGRQTVARIHAYGRQQVTTALAHLHPLQQQTVAQGLSAYAGALQTHRLATGQTLQTPFTIRSGYQTGMIGRITEMHAEFYSRHAGFGAFFESQVAAGLAEFTGRLDPPGNQIWLAMLNDRIVGSVAIDGQALGQNAAHLRWFILDEGCRGSGVGRQLLSNAMAFCDRLGFSAVHLWTFKGLDAARRLYESFGFELMQEEIGNQWGTIVTEQKFTRSCRPGN